MARTNYASQRRIAKALALSKHTLKDKSERKPAFKYKEHHKWHRGVV